MFFMKTNNYFHKAINECLLNKSNCEKKIIAWEISERELVTCKSR